MLYMYFLYFIDVVFFPSIQQVSSFLLAASIFVHENGGEKFVQATMSY